MIALCIGSALNVWDDVKRAKQLLGAAPHQVVVCNYTGIHYAGRIDAWCSLHPERFPGWIAQRVAKGFNDDFRIFGNARVCNSPGDVVPHRWKGSSGLYMPQIAIDELGAPGALWCGVPMEAEGGHIDRPGKWSDPDLYRPGFLQAFASGLNCRSMSGWTAELFGRPDAEWLAALGVPATAAAVNAAFTKGPSHMRITMTRTHNYNPPGQRGTYKYLGGEDYTVKRDWGDALVRLGVATEISGHSRVKADDAGRG